MSEDLLIEKKELLSKKLEEHTLAKRNSKLERKKGFLCTLGASGLFTALTGPICQTIPIILAFTTVGIITIGSIVTIIRSKIGFPKKHEIETLTREIESLENTNLAKEKFEEKNETYTYAQKPVVMEISKSIVNKYSNVDTDEFTK